MDRQPGVELTYGQVLALYLVCGVAILALAVVALVAFVAFIRLSFDDQGSDTGVPWLFLAALGAGGGAGGIWEYVRDIAGRHNLILRTHREADAISRRTDQLARDMDVLATEYQNRIDKAF